MGREMLMRLAIIWVGWVLDGYNKAISGKDKKQIDSVIRQKIYKLMVGMKP